MWWTYLPSPAPLKLIGVDVKLDHRCHKYPSSNKQPLKKKAEVEQKHAVTYACDPQSRSSSVVEVEYCRPSRAIPGEKFDQQHQRDNAYANLSGLLTPN